MNKNKKNLLYTKSKIIIFAYIFTLTIITIPSENITPAMFSQQPMIIIQINIITSRLLRMERDLDRVRQESSNQFSRLSRIESVLERVQQESLNQFSHISRIEGELSNQLESQRAIYRRVAQIATQQDNLQPTFNDIYARFTEISKKQEELAEKMETDKKFICEKNNEAMINFLLSIGLIKRKINAPYKTQQKCDPLLEFQPQWVDGSGFSEILKNLTTKQELNDKLETYVTVQTFQKIHEVLQKNCETISRLESSLESSIDQHRPPAYSFQRK